MYRYMYARIYMDTHVYAWMCKHTHGYAHIRMDIHIYTRHSPNIWEIPISDKNKSYHRQKKKKDSVE